MDIDKVIEIIEHYRKFACKLAVCYIGHDDVVWEEYKDLASRGSYLVGAINNSKEAV